MGRERDDIDSMWGDSGEDESERADTFGEMLDEGYIGIPVGPAPMFSADFLASNGERVKLYEEAKAAKVGTTIVCPFCQAKHKKTTYHKVFCSNGKVDKQKNCKDRFWNSATEERRNRTQRFG